MHETRKCSDSRSFACNTADLFAGPLAESSAEPEDTLVVRVIYPHRVLPSDGARHVDKITASAHAIYCACPQGGSIERSVSWNFVRSALIFPWSSSLIILHLERSTAVLLSLPG